MQMQPARAVKSGPELLPWDLCEIFNKTGVSVFEHAAAHKTMSVTITGLEQPERLQAFIVSANWLMLLGVEPEDAFSIISKGNRCRGCTWWLVHTTDCE